MKKRVNYKINLDVWGLLEGKIEAAEKIMYAAALIISTRLRW